jgi:WD40 repeat protein
LIGALLSSEAGNLYCWSLYGERKNMGMFYGPSKAGESILAMCTDATNRHLICGDTHGEIRVWNIENYCCSTTSPVQFDSSSPPLAHSWQAHLSPIIFCEWMDYKGHGDFIITGSTDHTARLWTISGEEIGIFGQRQPWDIELLLSSRTTNNGERNREESTKKNENDENGLCKSK